MSQVLPSLLSPPLQVCIDLFLLCQGYVDVATLSQLTSITCGSVYHYCPFDPTQDADEFYNDLRWNVIRPQVLAQGGHTLGWG